MAGSIPEDPPADEPESHADRFFSALRGWGLAEATLDQCLMEIMRDYETRRPYPPFPATIERKLEYLSHAVESFPALASARRWASMADATLTKHKDLRNAVVHGSPLHYEADGTVHFLMVQRRKRRLPTMVLRTVGPKQWDQLNRVSTQALGYLILVLFVLNPEEVRFHASNKITREVAVKLASRLPGSKALREFVAKVLAGET